MEDGELSNRVERFAARFVNEDSLLGDRRHDTVVDEVTHELLRRRLVDVRRRHSGRIPVLGEELGFMPLVIGCRVVEYVWIGHMNSRSGTLAGAPRAFRRRQTVEGCGRLLVPQSRDSVFDPVEDKPEGIAMIARPRGIVAGCGGSWWGMEMVPCIVGVRVSIPPALPGVVRILLSIVDFEIVVRVPTNSHSCLVDGFGIVHWCECDTEFEMPTCVRDDCLFDLLCRLQARLEKFE